MYTVLFGQISAEKFQEKVSENWIFQKGESDEICEKA